MGQKELKLLGKAMQYLYDLGALDHLKAIIDDMAENPSKLTEKAAYNGDSETSDDKDEKQ